MITIKEAIFKGLDEMGRRRNGKVITLGDLRSMQERYRTKYVSDESILRELRRMRRDWLKGYAGVSYSSLGECRFVIWQVNFE